MALTVQSRSPTSVQSKLYLDQEFIQAIQRVCNLPLRCPSSAVMQLWCAAQVQPQYRSNHIWFPCQRPFECKISTAMFEYDGVDTSVIDFGWMKSMRLTDSNSLESAIPHHGLAFLARAVRHPRFRAPSCITELQQLMEPNPIPLEVAVCMYFAMLCPQQTISKHFYAKREELQSYKARLHKQSSEIHRIILTSIIRFASEQ